MSEHKGRGGARPGAGRKKGSGKYNEPTKVMRLPESKIPVIKAWLEELVAEQSQPETLAAQTLPNLGDSVKVKQANLSRHVSLPLFSNKVLAGAQAADQDNIEGLLDLNQELIKRPETTFLLKSRDDSMKKVGIYEGDILIVDRSLEPTDGKVVIALLEGELTVKRLSVKSTGKWLVPENDRYLPILVRENSNIVIWGVVTSSIRQF